jgi:hypothetical protein
MKKREELQELDDAAELYYGLGFKGTQSDRGVNGHETTLSFLRPIRSRTPATLLLLLRQLVLQHRGQI